MPRPKKKPDFDPQKISKALMDSVVESYLNPVSYDASREGTASLNVVAAEFSMTSLKVRKLLITSGVYESEIADTVNELKESGKTIAEIQQLTGLSRASVHGYLPYTKGIYKTDELSVDLCDKCGCSPRYLSRCERGKATIGLDLLYSIAVETGKGMDYFLMDSPKSNPDIKINGVLAELLSKCSPKLLMTIEDIIRSLLDYEDGMRGRENGSRQGGNL